MPQLLCENCKGIWISYRKFPFPRLCPSCMKKKNFDQKENFDSILKSKTETIDLL